MFLKKKTNKNLLVVLEQFDRVEKVEAKVFKNRLGPSRLNPAINSLFPSKTTLNLLLHNGFIRQKSTGKSEWKR